MLRRTLGALSLSPEKGHSCRQGLRRGPMQAFLVMFLGAGLGGALRHGVNLVVAWILGTSFPAATLAINVSGSLIMGLLAGYFALKGDPGQMWRLFLATGGLGGYTTLSTFSLDAAVM